MIVLRVLNLMFLLGLVVCLAGAMAGLIVFAPFVGGAWLLTLIAIVGLEPDSPTARTRFEPQAAMQPRCPARHRHVQELANPESGTAIAR